MADIMKNTAIIPRMSRCGHSLSGGNKIGKMMVRLQRLIGHKLAGNGLKMSLSLEPLQEFCELLASILLTTRAQLKQLESLDSILGPPSTVS